MIFTTSHILCKGCAQIWIKFVLIKNGQIISSHNTYRKSLPHHDVAPERFYSNFRVLYFIFRVGLP